MKKRTLFRSGAAFLMGLLMTAAVGCFTSFAYDSARLKACSVENGNSISVTGTATAGALNEGETPDDGYYYLFELHPYESEIGSRTDYIAWSNKSDKLKFTLKYSGDSTDTMLYSRFVVALKTGSTYTPISNAIYVTNPGDVAKYREDYPEPMSKKGLLIQLDMLGDALNLGVKHTTVNIPYHQLVGGNLKYKYNGKTYNFNGDLIKDYDKMISAFSAKGIVVTAILLNGRNDNYPELHEAGI